MSLLKLERITFEALNLFIRDSFGSVHEFSGEFSFGKSYLLDANLNKGAWALSRIIGGALTPDRGEITKDGISYGQKVRHQEAWFVRESEYSGFRAGSKTVKTHLQHGLKNNPAPFLPSEQTFIEQFMLTPERYDRAIRQLSHEGWRASCAIGLAHGRKIFCFPSIEYVRPYLIEDYFDLWLKAIVDLLSDSGALVLIPAIATGLAANLCDEIVSINHPNGAES
jgi:hypothetical protein